MEKVRKLACFTRYSFYLMAIITVAVLSYKWYFYNDLKNAEPGSYAPFLLETITVDGWTSLAKEDITPLQKIGGFLIQSVSAAFLLLVYKNLIGAMRLFEQGTVFSQAVAQRFYSAGKFLLFSVVAEFFLDGLASLLITMNNPAGERMLQLQFDHDNIFILVLSLIIYLIAHIMSEASKLQHEIDHTI